MRWTERQRAMLREMGVRLWERGSASSDAGVALLDDAAGTARHGSPQAAPAGTVASAGTAPAVAASAGAAPTVAAQGPGVVEPATHSSATSLDATWRPADWLIVGEAFGALADGAPATSSGDQERLLANMLQAIGVSRNAPERATRACYVGLAEGTRGLLDAALEQVAPRLILALGRAAAEALLEVDEPIGRLRGRIHARAGIRVVVSFPLAYLLRHPAEKAKAWADLCLAVRSLESAAAGG